MNAVSGILVIAGVIFLGVGSLGVIRMPDFFTRAHAIGKADTLGGILLLGGMALYHGFELASLKLLLILGFIAIANPTAAHALTRAALRSGLTPWMRDVPADGAPGRSDPSGDEPDSEGTLRGGST